MSERGFTLIELVTVMLVIALASVPLFGQFSSAASRLLEDEKIQTAVQLAQERAEALIALRRSQGFVAVPVGTLNDTLAGNYTAYSRQVTVNQPPTGPGCPTGASCKEVIIAVNRDARTRARLSFVLVDY